MPDLAPFHSLIVFAHVIGVFIFLLAHGVSAGVMVKIRSERDPASLRALLDFSRWSMNVMGMGLLVWLISGVLAGFSGNHWTSGRYWIWASLAIALLVTIVMTPLGRMYLNRVREAVGINPRSGAVEASDAVDSAALEAALASGRPILLASIGVLTVVVLTWLMMFKPF